MQHIQAAERKIQIIWNYEYYIFSI